MDAVNVQSESRFSSYDALQQDHNVRQHDHAAQHLHPAAVVGPGLRMAIPATVYTASSEATPLEETFPTAQHVQTLSGTADPPKDSVNQPAWQGYNSVFTAAKAGMQNVDKEKVKKVVYEMSKDSAHFKNEQRKQAQVDAKIAQLKARAAAFSPSELAAHQKACDIKITQLEATRDLTKTWLHVDMDAFYASVEELAQPELKSKPMAVGGIGMICTANYKARKFGVRSAMPGFIARKLCPQLVFVKPDFVKYTAASEQTRTVFRLYDPDFEAGSLDEAYLDVTTYCKEHAVTGAQVAAELRAKVTAATQLTCSVGVAPNVTLAKVASDMNKPDGQAVVDASRDAVMAFMHNLPIRKIPGIGKVSEQTLNALGINTCSEIIHQRALIAALLSPISCNFLLRAGLGLGATEHGSRTDGQDSSLPRRKGISCERTFSAISSPAAMEQMAGKLVQHLAADMTDEGIAAKTLTLKLKTTAFQVRTRAVTLPQHVSTAHQMLQPILKLLKAELPVEIRLMGVRGSNLRKVHKPGEVSSAGGHKPNALQRMILQCQLQQQGGQHQSEEQRHGSRQLLSGNEEQHKHQQHQEQWASGVVHSAVDVLDEGQYGSETTAVAEDDVSDDNVTVVSHASMSATKDAAGYHQPEPPHYEPQQQQRQQQKQQPAHQQEEQQQEGQVALGHWGQQWQLRGQQDQVSANMQFLHQQVQGHIEGSTHLSSPVSKRLRLCHTQQNTGESILHEQIVAAGQLGKESQLIVPPQVVEQQPLNPPGHKPGHMQVAGCGPGSQQQLDMQQQQQQQQQQWQQQQQQSTLNDKSSPELLQQPIASSSAGVATAAAAAEQPETQAALAAAAGVDTGQPRERQQAKHASCGRQARPMWTCQACTYSSNKAVMLRCEVCDTPKGDRSAPPVGWLCTRSSRESSSKANSKAGNKVSSKAGSRDKRRQSDVKGAQHKGGQSGTRQMSLDGLVQ